MNFNTTHVPSSKIGGTSDVSSNAQYKYKVRHAQRGDLPARANFLTWIPEQKCRALARRCPSFFFLYVRVVCVRRPGDEQACASGNYLE